jgi:anti-sigma regulatory factor (Ser/Thr protein kinase)
MRPDQAAPPKVARAATGEPRSARQELERLGTVCRQQERVFHELRVRAAALHAASAELRDRAAALRAPVPTGARAGARNARALALDEHAPADARRMVTVFLNDQVPACVLDNARLVVSELVSNSVRHSGVSDGVVVVDVQLTAGMVRLEVADPGRAGVIGPRSPDHAGGGGFGLQLVASLSERWGLERVAAGGTRIWAQLLRTPPASNGGPPLELERATPLVQDRTREGQRSPPARTAARSRAYGDRTARAIGARG